ncbi:hypothetical protein C882_1930 [Caenispirillum salinarum AK4]|uniref:Uncharacterized protein n=1 Tax=Caenispirillum salinarum AK4 TaxID=1238182 RepID=K9HE73_9PROT|nr:hypothetical protein [Caenispirillum salinarum]EKV27001.1 hypothetical protein C882_1930 [Caenispirillum salinarum AK4]
MTRPTTLSETYDRIAQGEPREGLFAGFLDTFYGTDDLDRQAAMLADEPALLEDARLNALAGGMAEYLSKQVIRRAPPRWASGPARRLAEPWFTVENAGPGMKEWLVFSSPAEFLHRNIFTESQPFRRASQARPRSPS